MLLSYEPLKDLVENGVIDAPIENINAASIEVTLGNRFYIEQICPVWVIHENTKASELFINLHKKQNAMLELVTLNDDECMVLKPGAFVLAETVEYFNLPDNIVADYVLKSSQARNGWGHQLAGFCDPGWHSSRLTMEFTNDTQDQYLVIKPGQKCGQMKFHIVEQVPDDKSYRIVGQYNHQHGVTSSKGIR
jgi:dCTP deaminase